ncbi:hypothetical protein [Desmospora activa]|uniref:Uncharacterized protein n=1 Tax=Desmospora activa DSM 45169 TaxID=1121389 RepID=A0A2T4ZDI1_9BACL|nr:hypothetical protein [Desmospora activa]PTM59949.1 hypothetical protein C8J48_2587 [Desmospora activa DSM 45169]
MGNDQPRLTRLHASLILVLTLGIVILTIPVSILFLYFTSFHTWEYMFYPIAYAIIINTVGFVTVGRARNILATHASKNKYGRRSVHSTFLLQFAVGVLGGLVGILIGRRYFKKGRLFTISNGALLLVNLCMYGWLFSYAYLPEIQKEGSALQYEDRQYSIMREADVSREHLGKTIGVSNASKIYAIKGFSTTEWLATCVDANIAFCSVYRQQTEPIDVNNFSPNQMVIQERNGTEKQVNQKNLDRLIALFEQNPQVAKPKSEKIVRSAAVYLFSDQYPFRWKLAYIKTSNDDRYLTDNNKTIQLDDELLQILK